jgi:hypothetical protein
MAPRRVPTPRRVPSSTGGKYSELALEAPAHLIKYRDESR